MPDVKCRVSSCYYWGTGDECHAESITVDNNTNATYTSRMEAGDMDFDKSYGTRKKDDFETGSLDYDRMDTGNAGKTYGARTSKTWETGNLEGNVGQGIRGGKALAYTSEATCCRTFRPKETASKS